MTRHVWVASVLTGLLLTGPARSGDDLPKQAADGLRRATEFFRKEVAPHGAYLWQYSADLKRREGEGQATETMGWVQPPGTPSVGLAYLRAWERTGDDYYRDAARETGTALVRSQLRSGGWDYRMEFDPQKRRSYAFRVDEGSEKAKNNVTTLDDNTTQEALRFLMRLDVALGRKDAAIHEAVAYALDALLKAQYPNGGWPQRYDRFPDPADYPVKKASYPETWSRTYPSQKYANYYTLNDNSLADVIDVLFEAGRLYKDDRYTRAAVKAGDFLLLAQMPEPQPIWAQQYDAAMQPAWARKFEPPGVTGGESQGVIRTLMRVYQETGDEKYLATLPRAIAYLRSVELPGGKLARFYELKTSKPLYFTTKYELTYDDGDLPTHYGFKVSSRADALEKELEKVRKAGPNRPQRRPEPPRVTSSLTRQVQQVLRQLDGRGRWTERGKLRAQKDGGREEDVLTTRTFIRNADILSTYLHAVRAGGKR